MKFGIHVNDKPAPYTADILGFLKTIETRFRPTLRPFVGQRVWIIRTGKGPAQIVGSVEISEEIYMDRQTFDQLRDQHRVPAGSAQDLGTRPGKYGYILKDPIPLANPITIGTRFFTGNRTYRILPDTF